MLLGHYWGKPKLPTVTHTQSSFFTGSYAHQVSYAHQGNIYLTEKKKEKKNL